MTDTTVYRDGEPEEEWHKQERAADTGQLGQPIEEVKDEQPDDTRLWSVTTILGVLDKPALMYWAAELTGEAALDSLGSLALRVEEEGRPAVVKWLRDARFRLPKDRLSASKLGNCAHALCEEYALTGVRPDKFRIAAAIRAEGGNKFTSEGVKNEGPVLSAMLDQFDGWLARFQPSYQSTEVVVYHPEYGYAGTCDCFLTIDGVPLIGDYKTSRTGYDAKGQPKSPYPEVGLQLAAYRYAQSAAVWRPRRVTKFSRRYYLLSDAERDLSIPVPQVEAGVAIHLTPDHCEAFTVRCDEAMHRAFLYVMETARYQFELAPTVVGLPLVRMETT